MKGQIQRSRESQQLFATMKANIPAVRAAGLASINPTLGTSGSTPNLGATYGGTGRAMLDGWRNNVPPFAMDQRRTKVYEREMNDPY